jgi:hypothetical protein
MVAWRNWDWQALAIIATIIGAAYLLGRDTVSPGEVRAIVTDAVGTAVAEAVRPLATRDAIDNLRDGQRAQSNCLSDLYAYVQRGRPSMASSIPACERLAESGR